MFDSALILRSEFNIFAIIVGSVIALLYIRYVGVSPGGIIPIGGSFILALHNPLWLLYCIISSFACYWVYLIALNRFGNLGRYAHVYLMGIASMIFGLIGSFFVDLSGISDIGPITFVGFLIPALLADQYRFQGSSATLVGFLLCIAFSLACIYLVISLTSSFGLTDVLFSHFEITHISGNASHVRQYPLVSLISLVFGFAVYRRLGISSGGYIMSPLAAQLLESFNCSLILFSGLFLLYLFQTLLLRHTFIVGLQRYVATLIASAIYVWIFMAYLQAHHSSLEANLFGSAWIVVLVLASYSTDAFVYRRQSAFVFIAINFVFSYLLIKISLALPVLAP